MGWWEIWGASKYLPWAPAQEGVKLPTEHLFAYDAMLFFLVCCVAFLLNKKMLCLWCNPSSGHRCPHSPQGRQITQLGKLKTPSCQGRCGIQTVPWWRGTCSFGGWNPHENYRGKTVTVGFMLCLLWLWHSGYSWMMMDRWKEGNVGR